LSAPSGELVRKKDIHWGWRKPPGKRPMLEKERAILGIRRNDRYRRACEKEGPGVGGKIPTEKERRLRNWKNLSKNSRESRVKYDTRRKT